MTGSKNGNEPETKSPRESGEDSEDESEILEESPCGRWSKRRQEVSCCTAIHLQGFRGGTFVVCRGRGERAAAGLSRAPGVEGAVGEGEGGQGCRR